MIHVNSPLFLDTFCPENTEALSLFCFLIHRNPLTERIIIHETIHWHQCLEMGVIGFWIVYFYYIYTVGYWNSPFEREAYWNDKNPNYLNTRKLYSWTKYIS